jgi:hypothetical protein
MRSEKSDTFVKPLKTVEQRRTAAEVDAIKRLQTETAVELDAYPDAGPFTDPLRALAVPSGHNDVTIKGEP